MVRSLQRSIGMKCPHCGSEQSSKNGHRRGKQNYRCKRCDRQFLETYAQRGYTEEIKQLCLRMSRLGLTLRQIETLTGVRRSTVSLWCRQAALNSDRLKETKNP